MTSLFRNKRWVQFNKELRRALLYIWGTVILDIAINATANFTTMPTDTPLSRLLLIHLAVAYPIPVFTCLGFLVLLTLLSWTGGSPDKTSSKPAQSTINARDDQNLTRTLGISGTVQNIATYSSVIPSTQELRHTIANQAHLALLALDLTNRIRLLKRVRTIWIEGVLNHSLHQAALIALDMQEMPDALAHPWHLQVQETHLPSRPLAPDTRITQVYDETDGTLLVLGEPGAGKTTLLLELARDLIERAEHDSTHPIPIVFNLSSWATKRRPLTEWLVEELNAKYQVPEKIGKAWVKADKLLPLLDGLDEVTPQSRAACINALNTYRQEHDLVPMVVCSRRTEYLAQSTQVLLHTVVVIQPLTQEQIDMYLSSIGRPMEAVRLALHDDSALQELVSTPLMLSVLTLAHHERLTKMLITTASPKDRQWQILATYVQRMLERRGAEPRYPPQQTIRWLSWLALQLKQHNQTEFYLEQMQPDWLVGSRLHPFYKGFCLRWIGGCFFGFLFGLPILLILTLVSHLSTNFPDAFLTGLEGGICLGLFFGLFLGRALRIFERRVSSPSSSMESILKHLVTSLIYGVTAGFGYAVGVYQFLLGGTRSEIITGGLSLSLLFWICFALDTRRREIQPAENLVWSWREILRRLPFTLPLGIAVPVVAAISYPAPDILQIVGGTVTSLVIVLVSGLSSGMSEKSAHIKPNEGIRNSVRNGVQVGLAVGVAVGLGIWFLTGIVQGFAFGLCFGFYFWLLSGGRASLLHLVLRFLLWKAGSIPLDYAGFLDYAAEHILLRKVGGGYIFIHRLLLEYFASLEVLSPSELVQQEQRTQSEVCQCGYQDDRIGMLFCPVCGKSKV